MLASWETPLPRNRSGQPWPTLSPTTAGNTGTPQPGQQQVWPVHFKSAICFLPGPANMFLGFGGREMARRGGGSNVRHWGESWAAHFRGHLKFEKLEVFYYHPSNVTRGGCTRFQDHLRRGGLLRRGAGLRSAERVASARGQGWEWACRIPAENGPRNPRKKAKKTGKNGYKTQKKNEAGSGPKMGVRPDPQSGGQPLRRGALFCYLFWS